MKQIAPRQDKSGVLARRIIILCISLVLTILIVFTLILFVNLSNNADRNLRSTAELTMRYINMDIQNTLLPAIDLANSTAAMVTKIESNAVLELVLREMLPTVSIAVSVYYGTAASRFEGGSFVSSTDFDFYGSDPEWDHARRPWFISGIQNPGMTVFTTPYVDARTGQLRVALVRTVIEQGQVTGVVGTDIVLDVLTEIVISHKITGDGSTYVVDKSGLYIVHETTDFVLNRNFFETDGREMGRNLSSGVQITVLGNTYWTSMPIEGTDWYIVSTGSTAELNRDFQRLLTIIFILGLVMVFVAIIISMRFSLIISKPVVRMAAALKDIAQGEGDLTRNIDSSSKDEIGDLAYYFNLTLEKIKNLIINIKKEADILSDIGNDLASNMNETAAGMNEITANINSIKERIMNQSASVSETHATMEQVVTNINKLNGHVENQSNNVSQASSAIEEMVANIQSVTTTLINNADNVDALTEASDVGRTGLSEVAEDIQEIARESEGLLEINAVMENIASQTNLLSMNAAIEAAHAGEAGKGFSVVAEEIRKLAESSKEQSDIISNVLKKMKESIDKITNSTENVLTKFEAIDKNVKSVAQQEENIRHAMEEQDHGSKQILDGIGNVNEITRQVKSGSNEMLDGAKEVIDESERLEKATQEITTGMNEMTNGVEHINLAVNHVNDISIKNREAINALLMEVSRFKVE
jgi:methyl-accepting chemotaxis protein